MTATRFRQRKLSTKVALQVIDDTQIDATDDDTRHIAAIESGVERTEETEHHLQVAISAANAAALGTKVKSAFIPTPDASKVISNYDNLYRKVYSHPQSYIRFSSTVEDSSGSLYCIDEEDDKYLAQYNSKRSQGTQCSEERFEEIIDEFENLTTVKQPYRNLNDDETVMVPLLTFEEMEDAAFEDDYNLNATPFAKDLFNHWTSRRSERNGKPLMPFLKFEQGQIDKDDGDPYVCFRRREHRPARKTRRTDAQSIDKLKRLRLDMERVRSLAKCVMLREDTKKQNQDWENKVYSTRMRLKKLKREYNITGDDDDLVNKPRKKVVEPPPPVVKPPVRTETKPAEADLVQLDDLHTLRSKSVNQAIEEARKKRQYNSAGWTDHTMDYFKSPPLSPAYEATNNGFRTVRTYYAQQLPSPPPSQSSTSPSSPRPRSSGILQPRITFQTSPPSPAKRKREEEDEEEPSDVRYRRRFGRVGQLWLDRRGMKLKTKDREIITIDDRTADRFKFDNDDSDEEMQDYPYPCMRPVDNDKNLQFRANLFLQQVMPRGRQQLATESPSVAVHPPAMRPPA